jgi:hypothetical protein
MIKEVLLSDSNEWNIKKAASKLVFDTAFFNVIFWFLYIIRNFLLNDFKFLFVQLQLL